MESVINMLYYVLELIDQLKIFVFIIFWVGGCGQYFIFFVVENIDDLEVVYDFEFFVFVELDQFLVSESKLKSGV